MKTFIKLVLLLTVISAGQAQAAFVGAYQLANWTKAVNGGKITTDALKSTVTLVSSDNNGGNKSQNFTIKALADGLVSFNWNFKTDDGHSTTVKVGNEKVSTRSSFDPFGYLLNNVFVQLTQNAYKEDSQSGTVTFAVKKGDLFGFSAFSTTSNKGSATTTVSGFSFINEPSKAPSAVPVPAALWLMMVPMAGLSMFRKKA